MIGNLGINVDADNGFDIGGNSAIAYALLKVNNVSAIYSINLTTGAAKSIRYKYPSYCNGSWFRF
jgi:hypothetical protein